MASTIPEEEKNFFEHFRTFFSGWLESKLPCQQSKDFYDAEEIRKVGLLGGYNVQEEISRIAVQVITEQEERNKAKQPLAEKYLDELMTLRCQRFKLSISEIKLFNSQKEQKIIDQLIEAERSRVVGEFVGNLKFSDGKFCQEQRKKFEEKLDQIWTRGKGARDSVSESEATRNVDDLDVFGGGNMNPPTATTTSGSSSETCIPPQTSTSDAIQSPPNSCAIQISQNSNTHQSSQNSSNVNDIMAMRMGSSGTSNRSHISASDNDSSGSDQAKKRKLSGNACRTNEEEERSGSESRLFACMDCNLDFATSFDWDHHNSPLHGASAALNRYISESIEENTGNDHDETGAQEEVDPDLDIQSFSSSDASFSMKLLSSDSPTQTSGSDVRHSQGGSEGNQRSQNQASQVSRNTSFNSSRPESVQISEGEGDENQEIPNDQAMDLDADAEESTDEGDELRYIPRPSERREVPLNSEHVITQEVYSDGSKIRLCTICYHNVYTDTGKGYHFICPYDHTLLCQMCGRRFNETRRMRSHERTHTNQVNE